MKKVLVIAVHPDDETLGCGGALLKHKKNGDSTAWLIITSMKSEDGFDKEKIENRKREIQTVQKEYGFDKTYNLNMPTLQLDIIAMRDLIGRIEEVFNEFRPDLVYLPFAGDVHSDHRKVFDASFSCTKISDFPL